jgi:hypothetical protein
MRHTSHKWSLLALLSRGTYVLAADNPLPYNPTRILTSANSTSIYLFQPAEDGKQAGLSLLDISKTFSTAGLEPASLEDTLPFLANNASIPYTPVIDSSGNVTVLSGDCTTGGSNIAVWQYVPATADSNGNGEWSQLTISSQSLPNGIGFLGQAVPFASYISTEMSFYYFAGMCPSANSTAATWQSAANYSNAMLAFSPDASSPATLDAEAVSSRAPPVSEAGYSMTPLTATFSINATGEAKTTQQDFILIGGHTQGAFLNTSQVAVYSLPQEAWSFVPVQQPINSKIDLAVRLTSGEVEPRSGHTAVLSSDGTKIYVVGGWVGDVDTPASPQFAVLNLGAEYGGDASLAWTWSVPDQTGFGIEDGSGVYGHGAVMLPGGVMMVTGGYEIAGTSTSSRRTKRKTKRAENSGGIRLFNTTSSIWVESYTLPPHFTPAKSSGQASNDPLSKPSQQTGLGIGLGVGAIVLALLVAFYFWYMRRLRRIREERARELVMGASSDSSYSTLDPYSVNTGVEGRGEIPWATSEDQHGRPEMSHAGGATGMFVDNGAGSSRGSLRKSMISRPYSYQGVPRFDDNRGGNGAGIHPILERQDEDDTESPTEAKKGYVVNPFSGGVPVLRKPMRGGADYDLLSTSPDRPSSASNPFADPSPDHPNPLGSNPVSGPPSPTPPSLRIGSSSPSRRMLTAETDGSMNWTMIEGLELASNHSSSDPFSTGRSSPTRTDDRTSSTLSDQSHRSATSGTGTSFTRTLSTTAATLLSNALWSQKEATASSNPRPLTYAGPATHFPPPLNSHINTRYQSYSPPPRSSQGKKSYALSSAEPADTLLSHSSGAMRDDPYNLALAAQHPHSPQHHPRSTATVRIKPSSFMGSLRRALTAMGGEGGPRTFSFTGAGAEVLNQSQSTTQIDRIAAYHDDIRRSANSSPGKSSLNGAGGSAGPRRTVSESQAALAALKRKRGKKDWQPVGSGRAEDVFFDAGDWGNVARSNTSSTTTSSASSNPSSGRGGAGRSGTTRRRAGTGGKDGKIGEKEDWDVEDAVNTRDVQVLFTVPKTRLRVVNADVDGASVRSVSDGGGAAVAVAGRSSSAAV